MDVYIWACVLSMCLYMYFFACLGWVSVYMFWLACVCTCLAFRSWLAPRVPPPAVPFLWPWCLQPYLGYLGMDVAGSYVFRWDADSGSCAVFNVDDALLGAPWGVPWGSVVVVLLLAWSLPVFSSGDALSLRRITGRVCCFM